MYYIDNYGRFEIQVEQEFDGLIFQWRKYQNSPMIKKLGGMYANYCEQTNSIKFYKNEYIRDKALPKFIDSNNDIAPTVNLN